jgi:hypothetical protein
MNLASSREIEPYRQDGAGNQSNKYEGLERSLRCGHWSNILQTVSESDRGDCVVVWTRKLLKGSLNQGPGAGRYQ